MLKSLPERLDGLCFCAVGKELDEELIEWAQSQSVKIGFTHFSLFQLQFRHQN